MVRRGGDYGLSVTSKRHKRVVALTPATARMFLDYIDGIDGYVFTSFSNRSQGKQISRRSIRRIVDDALSNVGLKQEGLSVHALRHSAATNAIASGASLQSVGYQLGHADPRTTSIYSHVVDRWQSNPAQYLSDSLLDDCKKSSG